MSERIIDVQGAPGGEVDNCEHTISWSAHRELCQRVTELEARVAELLEEKNEPPDPDWERERGSD